VASPQESREVSPGVPPGVSRLLEELLERLLEILGARIFEAYSPTDSLSM